MIKLLLNIVFVFLLLSFLLDYPTRAQEDEYQFSITARTLTEGYKYDANSIIVKYKFPSSVSVNGIDSSVDTEYRRIIITEGVSTQVLSNLSTKGVPLPDVADTEEEMANVQKALEILLQDPNVEAVQPNYLYHTSWTRNNPNAGEDTPSDWNSSKQWYSALSNVPEMWQDQDCLNGGTLCGGSDNVIVAIIDTGLTTDNFDDTGVNSYYDINFTASDEYTSINYYINTGETPDNGLDDDCNGYVDDEKGIDTYFHEYWLLFEQSNTCPSGTPYSYTPTAFYRKAGHPADIDGHGTFVTGQVASVIEDGNEANPAAHNVSIMPIAATYPFPYNGFFDTITLRHGINYAVQEGADVINMSLGGSSPFDQAFENAVDNAIANNVVVVAASGNGKTLTCEPNGIDYPAAYDDVIAVGAVNSDGSRSCYSDKGTDLDLVAYVGQGSGQGTATYQNSLSCFFTINGCDSGSEFTTNPFEENYGIGTSFAAPQISAAAALVKSINPDISPYNLNIQLLRFTTIDVGDPGRDFETGNGAVDFENLYRQTKQYSWTQQNKSGRSSTDIAMAVFKPGADNRIYQSLRSVGGLLLTRYSTDGINWSSWDKDVSILGKPTFSVFNGKLYQIARQTDNRVYIRNTSDGDAWSSWIHLGVSKRNPESHVFNNRLFVTFWKGDSKSAYRYMDTLENWTTTFKDGDAATSTIMEVFNNQLFMAVRRDNNRMYFRFTSDGDNWSTWRHLGPCYGLPDLEVFDSGSGDRLYASVQRGDDSIAFRSANTSLNWSSWYTDSVTAGIPQLHTTTVDNENILYQGIRHPNGNGYVRYSDDATNWSKWQLLEGTDGNISFVDINSKTFLSWRNTNTYIWNQEQLVE